MCVYVIELDSNNLCILQVMIYKLQYHNFGIIDCFPSIGVVVLLPLKSGGYSSRELGTPFLARLDEIFDLITIHAMLQSL
jgi:hypothetical protein